MSSWSSGVARGAWRCCRAGAAARRRSRRRRATASAARATPQEIAGWDIDVRPDGRGLPRGPRQRRRRARSIYDAKCASCHGTFGESNDYMAIAGGVGTLASDQPIRTTGSKLNHATTLFDYIRRAMPFNAPQSLTDDEVYALTAYVLHLNDILPADASLDRDVDPRGPDAQPRRLHDASRPDGAQRQARHRATWPA